MREEGGSSWLEDTDGVIFRRSARGRISVFVVVLLTVMRREETGAPPSIYVSPRWLLCLKAVERYLPPASPCTLTVGRYSPPQSSGDVILLVYDQSPFYSDLLFVRAACQTPMPRLAGHGAALQPAGASYSWRLPG